MILPMLEKQQTNKDIHHLILSYLDQLHQTSTLSKEQLLYILDHISFDETEYLFSLANKKKQEIYQNKVYIRGLLEISNYCKQGCKYCGINHTNTSVNRYRLTKEEIMSSVIEANNLGYKTYVLQGGEDPHLTDEYLIPILQEIKRKFPFTRITLSLGERSYKSYQALFKAGADRYLLRHETASKKLYNHLHPTTMSFEERMTALKDLQNIGYQVGAGFMVNTPSQTNNDLLDDLCFLKEFKPEMIGIGPFLSHSNTIFKDEPSGTLSQSLVMVALTRLLLPNALLPATTALGTLDPIGREKAIKVGANVLMPNISPTSNRADYEIYENKICINDTVDRCRNCIEGRIAAIDHQLDLSVGDPIYY